MMILIHSLRDIPEDVNVKQNFSIEFKIFNIEIKYKLDLNNAVMDEKNNDLQVCMNKMRIFYFFSDNEEKFNENVKIKEKDYIKFIS